MAKKHITAMSALENTDFKGTVDINKAIINTQNIGKSDGMTIIVSDFLTENMTGNGHRLLSI